jgi:hypothetical protein
MRSMRPGFQTSPAVSFIAVDKINSEILRFAQNYNAGFVLTLQPFNSSTHHNSRPLRHLFRERALRTI